MIERELLQKIGFQDFIIRIFLKEIIEKRMVRMDLENRSLMILIAKTPESIKRIWIENISVDIDNSVSVIKQLFGDNPTIMKHHRW